MVIFILFIFFFYNVFCFFFFFLLLFVEVLYIYIYVYITYLNLCLVINCFLFVYFIKTIYKERKEGGGGKVKNTKIYKNLQKSAKTSKQRTPPVKKKLLSILLCVHIFINKYLLFISQFKHNPFIFYLSVKQKIKTK